MDRHDDDLERDIGGLGLPGVHYWEGKIVIFAEWGCAFPLLFFIFSFMFFIFFLNYTTMPSFIA